MVDGDLLVACAVLAAATYAIRAAGVSVPRSSLPEHAEPALDRAVVVLLAAVAVTAALYDGHQPADWTRIAGVATGVGAALLRLPLVIVILLAWAATAVLRLV